MRRVIAAIVMLACVGLTFADITGNTIFSRTDVRRDEPGPWASGRVPVPALPAAQCARFRITAEVVRSYEFHSLGNSRITVGETTDAVGVVDGNLSFLAFDEEVTPMIDTGWVAPGTTITYYFFHDLDDEVVITDPTILGDIRAGSFEYETVFGGGGIAASGSGSWGARFRRVGSIRTIAEIFD